MTSQGVQSGRARRPRWAWVVAACGLLAALAAVGVWAAFFRRGPAPRDPRVAYTGPFLNVRPDVPYVGDAACADCHREIAESYSRHPMARSLTPIARLAAAQPYDAAAHNPFEAFDSRFFVERRGDGVVQRQTRLDAAGRLLFERETRVDYAIGSGVHGYSYLTDRDGFVFQTPVSWYEAKRIWDVSPNFSPDHLGGRPVGADCLFCHANRTRPVAGTANRYEEPLFDGFGIGCERCHGPGGRHVQDPGREWIGGADPTIVDPKKLEPSLREAVCDQCHLEGAARVTRRGRDLYDFRPGLPLEAFRSVFVRTAGGGADRKAVNHVEQMEQSGCFRGGTAEDRIGCVSCHDPHVYVGPERRVAVYREACLNCHEAKHPGCSVPEAERRRTSPEDSCIQCHMPAYPASDIVHTASTDHRIPRRPGAAGDHAETSHPRYALALVHPGRPGASDPEYRRDLGLALAQLSRPGGASKDIDTHDADALLDEALKNFPDDAAAWEAKGQLAVYENRPADALTAFEACLALAPGREQALIGAAWNAQNLGKADAALDYWRRAVAVDPWSALARGNLAEVLAARGQWDEARAQCDEWVRLQPESADARELRIRCLLKAGDRAGAEEELKTLKSLRPGSEADLDHWFAKQRP